MFFFAVLALGSSPAAHCRHVCMPVFVQMCTFDRGQSEYQTLTALCNSPVNQLLWYLRLDREDRVFRNRRPGWSCAVATIGSFLWKDREIYQLGNKSRRYEAEHHPPACRCCRRSRLPTNTVTVFQRPVATVSRRVCC